MSFGQGLKSAAVAALAVFWIALAPAFAANNASAPPAPLFGDIPAPDDSWIPEDRRPNARSWKRGYAQAVSGEFDSAGLMKDHRACASDGTETAYLDEDCMAGFKRGTQEVFRAVEGEPNPGSAPCSFKFKRGATAQTAARCDCLQDFRAGVTAAARVCIKQLKNKFGPLFAPYGQFLGGLSATDIMKELPRLGKIHMNYQCSSRSCGSDRQCFKDMLDFQQVDVAYLGCFSAGFSQTHEVCSVFGVVPAQFQCLDDSFKQLNEEMLGSGAGSHTGTTAAPAKSP